MLTCDTEGAQAGTEAGVHRLQRVVLRSTAASRRARAGEAHQEIGGLRKSVLVAAERRDGARTRLDSIRSELDGWGMREYPTEELDYHEHDGEPQPAIDPLQMTSRLERAKAIVVRHHAGCPPLDAVIGQADKAIASLASCRV